MECAYQNILFGLLPPFISKEWGVTIQTFVQNDTNAPLVAAAIVRCSLNHLGRHVLAGPNN